MLVLTFRASAEPFQLVIGVARSRRVHGEPLQGVVAVEKSVSGCRGKTVWVTPDMHEDEVASPTSQRVRQGCAPKPKASREGESLPLRPLCSQCVGYDNSLGMYVLMTAMVAKWTIGAAEVERYKTVVDIKKLSI